MHLARTVGECICHDLDTKEGVSVLFTPVIQAEWGHLLESQAWVVLWMAKYKNGGHAELAASFQGTRDKPRPHSSALAIWSDSHGAERHIEHTLRSPIDLDWADENVPDDLSVEPPLSGNSHQRDNGVCGSANLVDQSGLPICGEGRRVNREDVLEVPWALIAREEI